MNQTEITIDSKRETNGGWSIATQRRIPKTVNSPKPVNEDISDPVNRVFRGNIVEANARKNPRAKARAEAQKNIDSVVVIVDLLGFFTNHSRDKSNCHSK